MAKQRKRALGSNSLNLRSDQLLVSLANLSNRLRSSDKFRVVPSKLIPTRPISNSPFPKAIPTVPPEMASGLIALRRALSYKDLPERGRQETQRLILRKSSDSVTYSGALPNRLVCEGKTSGDSPSSLSSGDSAKDAEGDGVVVAVVVLPCLLLKDDDDYDDDPLPRPLALPLDML